MKQMLLLSYTSLYSIVWDNEKPLLCNRKQTMDGYISHQMQNSINIENLSSIQMEQIEFVPDKLMHKFLPSYSVLDDDFNAIDNSELHVDINLELTVDSWIDQFSIQTEANQ
ncbi:Hypothetical_protein [Hexamita inflata]|uniref:Hypothetical_protein n=1 Tax=Hexamita inflata TaxID=28002 RepID=A0AA86N840_9EUKA|nr:Hypothetical protein HINF_LOCUS2121 [Hexamita inflata]